MTFCKLVERVFTKEQDLRKNSNVKLIRSLEIIAIITIRATYSGKGQLTRQKKQEQRELEHCHIAVACRTLLKLGQDINYTLAYFAAHLILIISVKKLG